MKHLDLLKILVIAISDASWNNLIAKGKKEATQAGMLILVADRLDFEAHGQGPVAIVGWRSHKLKRVTRSTMHGEAQGLSAEAAVAASGARDALSLSRAGGIQCQLSLDSYRPDACRRPHQGRL